MTVTTPILTNFLYRFEAGGSVFAYTAADEAQVYNNETYQPVQIDHSLPTFSAEPQQSEIDVRVHEAAGLMDLFINGPPSFKVKLLVYEYDRLTGTVTAYYRGWVVRSALELTHSIASLHCKTAWHFYDRESLSESLSVLSRYSVYDPRSGVDTSALGATLTVAALNSERDVLTVTGLTAIAGWYTAGILVAPNADKRTILKDETILGTRYLSLSAPFSQFTLDTGFSATAYPGDDLTYNTWANKFQTETNFGELWGGWQYMPNVDPAKKGVI